MLMVKGAESGSVVLSSKDFIARVQELATSCESVRRMNIVKLWRALDASEPPLRQLDGQMRGPLLAHFKELAFGAEGEAPEDYIQPAVIVAALEGVEALKERAQERL